MTWQPPSDMTKKQMEKESKRQAMLFEERVHAGQYIDGTIKLSEFIEKWLEDYGKEHLKATTYKNYCDCIKRINAALGHISLAKLQPHHIIEFNENMLECGIRGDSKFVACKDIKQILKERHIKRYELAAKAELALGTLRACMNGKNVDKKTAESVSKALKMPLSSLFKPCQEKEKLSGTSALYYYRVLSSILTTAVYWQVIPSNPCNRVKPPKAERKEAHYLDDLQAITLLEHLEKEPLQYRAVVTLLLYSGMRRGELCGLCWDDIDFENCIIDINKSSLYVSSRGIFDDDTKNKSSRRVIKIPAPVIELLKQHETEQIKTRLLLGDTWFDSKKVFTRWDGKPIHPDTLSGWFHDFIKKNDLPEITLHSLRHTNATLMIANGTDIKTVSKRLGHSNVTTTGNIYTHAIKTADEKAADTLQDILTPSKSKKA